MRIKIGVYRDTLFHINDMFKSQNNEYFRCRWTQNWTGTFPTMC